MNKKSIIMYTDGACSGNPGPGGWGTILKYSSMEKELSGGTEDTTNNRMELTAVIEGLRALTEPCKVDIYSDSKYVVDAIVKGWAVSWRERNWIKKDRSRAKNEDLWEQLLLLIEKHDVTMHWVRGHADNAYNNRCDELAVAQSMQYKK